MQRFLEVGDNTNTEEKSQGVTNVLHLRRQKLANAISRSPFSFGQPFTKVNRTT